MSPGCHSIPKTRRHIWDGNGKVMTWVWLKGRKGLVEEAGSSALILLILLMICSQSGLAGSNLSVTGQVNTWQQDGESAHCSKTILNLFKGERIISWLSEVSWPPHSPDCSLCNFFLWGWVKLQIWRVKPASIDDFKTAVEDINAAILDKYICTTAATIKKWCNAFLLADGGNFEQFLTSM